MLADSLWQLAPRLLRSVLTAVACHIGLTNTARNVSRLRRDRGDGDTDKNVRALVLRTCLTVAGRFSLGMA